MQKGKGCANCPIYMYRGTVKPSEMHCVQRKCGSKPGSKEPLQ